jgi:hypothetical protein
MHAPSLPAEPESIAAYLAELARDGKSVATIKGALAAIPISTANRGTGSTAMPQRSPP